MEKKVGKLHQLSSHITIIHRFAEKSELLATEAFTIFNQKREIHRIIALIIIHQATEHALKALCLNKKINIFKKGGRTISFEDALSNTNKFFHEEEFIALRILNKKRNEYQHSALFNLTDRVYIFELLRDILSIISKILEKVGYNPTEINLILKSDNKFRLNYEIESKIEEI